jgi:hypothetical protein
MGQQQRHLLRVQNHRQAIGCRDPRMRSPKPVRPGVTWNTNRNAVQTWFIRE